MGKTNDTPAKAERKAKRYTVIQRGPKVFEVLDTQGMDAEDFGDFGTCETYPVAARHKTARLARAVARELNGEE